MSVVIPMYNAEKYIGECLDSVLAQTFQNFEVIVVDDCSTDSSVAIVKSYAEKFGGRLTLSSLEKNSGSGALPRNKGIMLSRGEYIAFVDNDDAITPTALEELYTLAKEFNADVVYCENNYRVQADGTGLHMEINPPKKLVDAPTFEPENLPERVQRIIQGKYRAPQWLKLTRRRLIFDNELFFPNTRHTDDVVWTYGLAFYAKKFLRVPNIINIRRLTENSIMRRKKTPQQSINFWLNPIFGGLQALDKFMRPIEFFRANPDYRYAVLEKFISGNFKKVFKSAAQIPPFGVYETIKQEFGDRFGDYDVLIPALCAALNTQQKINVINVQNFNEYAAQAQAYIAQIEAELKRRN